MRLRLENLRSLPALYSQDKVQDPTVQAKLWIPGSTWTAYLTEFSEVAPDGVRNVGFGYVWNVGHGELEYVHPEQLLEITGPLGFAFQRQSMNMPLSDVMATAEQDVAARGLQDYETMTLIKQSAECHQRYLNAIEQRSAMREQLTENAWHSANLELEAHLESRDLDMRELEGQAFRQGHEQGGIER